MSIALLRRIWQKICHPTGLVGRDLEGNRYFEYPNPHGAFGRTKRVVKYRRGFDMWTYVAGERRLAVQWTSWLTHTRAHPPTMEELQADVERQRRIQLKVAMIEARDRVATASVEGPQAPPTTRPEPPDKSRTCEAEAKGDGVGQLGSLPSNPNNVDFNRTASTSASHQPPSSPSVYDGPHSWAPRTVRRTAG